MQWHTFQSSVNFGAKDIWCFRSARWNREYNSKLSFISSSNVDHLPASDGIHRPIIIDKGIKVPKIPLPNLSLQTINASPLILDCSCEEIYSFGKNIFHAGMKTATNEEFLRNSSWLVWMRLDIVLLFGLGDGPNWYHQFFVSKSP